MNRRMHSIREVAMFLSWNPAYSPSLIKSAAQLYFETCLTCGVAIRSNFFSKPNSVCGHFLFEVFLVGVFCEKKGAQLLQ